MKRPRARSIAGAAVVAGVAGVALAHRVRSPPHRAGVSAGRMEFSVVGDGPKTMLVLPGGPGSEIPSGTIARVIERGVKQYLDAGYTVWTATRPRNMPLGYSAADMADEYARFIREEIGQPVDVVLGQSFGGMLSIHLAADHPETLRRLVLVGSAATISEWGGAVDARVAALRAERRYAEAGSKLLASIVDVPKFAGIRSLAGRLAGKVLSGASTPLTDLVVEAQAEIDCDARDALAGIDCPVLLLAGESDRFFPLAMVEETAARIPYSTLVAYSGRGHAGLFTDSRIPRDVRDWLR